MSDDPWGAVLGPNAKPPVALPPGPSPLPAPAAAAQPDADPWHGVLGQGAPPASAPLPPSSASPPPASASVGAPAAQPGDFWTRWAGLKAPSDYDPNWKPSGNSFTDFMTRPLAKTEGVGEAAHDAGLAALDYGTLGYGVPASMTKDVAQAKANLGVMNVPLATALYTAGPGKILGPLARGSALAEGALFGGATTVSHGANGGYDTNALDIAKGVGEGALGGTIGQTVGKYGGALVRGAASKLGFGGDPAAVTSALEQAKTDAYSPFNDAFYHPADMGVGVDKVKASIYGADPTLSVNSPITKNLLDKYSDALDKAATNQNPAGGYAPQATTGASLNDTIQKLSKIANSNTNNFEGVAAQQARDGLTDLFHTTTPVSAPPGFDPVKQLAAAKIANGQFKDAETLQGWQKEINKYGGNVGNDVKAYNEKWYGQDGTPQDNALMGIYNTQQQSGAVPRWQTSLLHEGIGAGLGELGGSMAGLPHGLGAMLGMAGTYAIGKPLIKSGRAFSQGINTQQAFDQAYPAMTGRNLTPVDTQGLGEALRRLGIVSATNR